MSLPQVLARQHSVNDIVTEFKSIALACTGGTSSVFIPSGPISAASRDGEDDASQVVGASPLYATRSVAGSSATPSNHASIARESVSDVLHTDLPWSLVRYAVGCMETVVVGDVAQSNFAGDEYFQESSAKVRHIQSCTPLYHLCLMFIPERDGVSAVQQRQALWGGLRGAQAIAKCVHEEHGSCYDCNRDTVCNFLRIDREN